jgi:hypothetical protein
LNLFRNSGIIFASQLAIGCLLKFRLETARRA